MTTTVDWSRPHWSPPHWSEDDASATLVYFVFGEFGRDLESRLSAAAPLPPGLEIRRLPKATLAHWDGHPLRGALGDTLHDADPAAFEAAGDARDCLMLRGEFRDSDSLLYLRDTLAAVAALLDAGGNVVVDPQILDIFSDAGWRKRYAGTALSEPRNHVLIFQRDDGNGDAWIKTRGMRKFARPDFSIRGVPRIDVEQAGAVAAGAVNLAARGMRFGSDSKVRVKDFPAGLEATYAGSLDDPEFNNVHLEIGWPRPGRG